MFDYKVPQDDDEISMPKADSELFFTREKSFKLQITNSTGLDALIEGQYVHEPLNSRIIGRYHNYGSGTKISFTM